MTIGELKRAIAALPDDAQVLVAYEGSVTAPAFRLNYEPSPVSHRVLTEGPVDEYDRDGWYPALVVVAP